MWLQKMGTRVVGYALPPPTQPSLFEIADVAEGMESTIGDIRDLDQLSSAMARARPDIVIHMAAQALVRRSYNDPIETYSTNVMGTVNLLEAVRRSRSVRVVLIITSDKCYDNKEWIWAYRENEPVGGRDPYSSSKACAELVTAAYRDSFFLSGGAPVAVATARAGNVIGGGDWGKDRLVPDIIRAVSDKRPVQIRSPQAVRPWQHVLDALSGYLLLAERLSQNADGVHGAWNFGPDPAHAKPVEWIVAEMGEFWGTDFRWELDPAAHPHEANSLNLDSSKARKLLGWSPRLSLSDQLKWVVEWHLAFREGKDMREATWDQIRRFGETAPS